MPKRSGEKRPSMYDVARLAGVSQTTVSFVVNNTPNVNIPAETRERVMAAIQELGWRPNVLARALSQRQSETIGFISDEIATTSFAGKIIQGAQDAAWASEKMLLVLNTGADSRLEQRAFEMMLERQVDGLIYATMYHHAVELPPIARELPLVLLDCFIPGGAFPSVVPDEVQGGRTATETLIRKGHRRIAFINNDAPIPATIQRLEGYKAALEAAGIGFDPALVRVGPPDAAHGYRATLELLSLPERPTAIFCFRDIIAIGVYDAIKSRGLRIPGDVAVIGFDNLEVVAEHLNPPLTTVALPHYQMGEWAVRRLLQQPTLSGEARSEPYLMHCSLVERESI